MSFLDCEGVRHVELDADCRLYIGQVRAGGLLNGGRPVIHLGRNGRIDELFVQEQSEPNPDDGSAEDAAEDSAA